jgi:uncharacterized membrane protein YdjX (TVP38/TMEM64 family)
MAGEVASTEVSKAATRPRGALPKLAAVAAVLALLGAAYKYGIFARLSTPELFALWMQGLGVWGYVAYLVAYATLQPFGIPGTVFVVAAALIWPWPVAYALSMIGTMAATTVGFNFARFVARDLVAKRIPKKFANYSDALERNGFWTVAALRFVFWMPPLLHAFFGISKVRGSAHFWGSLVGYALPLLAMSYFGKRLFDAIRHASAETWIEIALAIAAIVIGFWWMRRQKAQSAARPPREQ